MEITKTFHPKRHLFSGTKSPEKRNGSYTHQVKNPAPTARRSFLQISKGRNNLLRSLKGAGLDHLDFFQIHEDAEESRVRIKEAKVVVYASAVASRLPKLGIPADVEVIVQDRTLSKGGVEMLGCMLRRSS